MPSNAYSNLLQHLHRAQPALPLETIQAALAFHIANQNPLPTPLAATAITSPLFLSHPFTLSRLQVLSNSFRHALHLKFTLVSGPRLSFFEGSISTRLTEWTKSLMKGLQGGNPLLRLAAAGGVLQGLQDLQTQAKANSSIGMNSSHTASENPVSDAIRAKVEDEVVIAFAEVIDQEGVGREWESEFQQTTLLSNTIQDAPADQISSPYISLLTLSLILAGQSLPLVASSKLKALPLAALSQLLTSYITETFHEGDFLRQSAASDTLRLHIASLSRLEALVLSIALDYRPRIGLTAAQETLNHLREMAHRVAGVIPHLLAGDTHSASDAETPSSGPWLTLKTLLFSAIMITDSVLSACIYVPPTVYHLSSTSSLSSPASLSLTTILTLFHLSFVVSQFGGISSLGNTDEASFKELRKTAYLALDILASGSNDVPERFLDELMNRRVSILPQISGSQELRHSQAAVNTVVKSPIEETIALAQISFALSCIEQLVPVLSVRYLKGPVWTLIAPNLVLRHPPYGTLEFPSSSTARQPLDQLRRETFESAHSVVLAILAANAANVDAMNKGSRTQELSDGSKGKATEEDMSLSDFCTRLVPFYSKSLIQNSAPGKLSTSQVRIAYAALVRSASNSVLPTQDESENPSHFTLAWYCIDELLCAIRSLGNDKLQLEQKHRLRLTLMSCVSALPLSLLGRFFEEINDILKVDIGSKDNLDNTVDLVQRERDRTELIQALYREISEMVGDREKGYVLSWWSAFATENSTASSRSMIAKL
ncbi:hypothetical protein DFH05DRAFT_770744 [Lentinula detonsa]|uniref:Peroxisomal membrane protein n=1 Tax=Lentinula detonsa TaxID=2804962 RepID=A0A9W8P566_9AGAR|nr:hypothetical protein DFH05DRAFT_770744 [Lentinula detonsa]